MPRRKPGPSASIAGNFVVRYTLRGKKRKAIIPARDETQAETIVYTAASNLGLKIKVKKIEAHAEA